MRPMCPHKHGQHLPNGTHNTPTTINVETFPDFSQDDNNSTFEFKSKQRHEWNYGSITKDGKIIIPIGKNDKISQ